MAVVYSLLILVGGGGGVSIVSDTHADGYVMLAIHNDSTQCMNCDRE